MGETFLQELEQLINKHSVENGSNTPDFILARYLADALQAYERAVCTRESWFGRSVPGLGPTTTAPASAPPAPQDSSR